MIICICNQKGGAGKTVTALNMFGHYTAKGKNPALIDLDLEGRALNVITQFAPDSAKHVYAGTGQDLDSIESLICTAAEDGHDMFILDCPPNLGQIVASAAILADAIVIPAKTSIQDQSLTLKTAKHMKMSQPLKPVMILPTDIVKNQIIAKRAMDSYNSFSPKIDVLRPIRRAACIEQAGFQGMTIQECDQSSDHPVVTDYKIAFKGMEDLIDAA